MALVNNACHEIAPKPNTLYANLPAATAAVATSSDFLTPGLAYLHAQPHASPAADPGAMSIIQVLRRPDYELWLKAIDKERLDLGDYFLDGIPALERVPRADVPRGASRPSAAP